jgi:hypothetical protein
MDLEETEARSDYAVEGQQQSSRQTAATLTVTNIWSWARVAVDTKTG